jgi:hypothetical protein
MAAFLVQADAVGLTARNRTNREEILMSRTMLLVSTALLASLFRTQAFAEEVKYDVQNCFAGPIQITQEDGLVAGSYAVLGIAPGNKELENCQGAVWGPFRSSMVSWMKMAPASG